MISKEGSLISATYAELRKFGFIVVNLNTQRHTGQIKGLTDYIIIGRTGMHFVEVKLSATKDKAKPHQVLVEQMIESVAERTQWVHYWRITSLEEAVLVFNYILNGTDNQKGELLFAV